MLPYVDTGQEFKKSQTKDPVLSVYYHLDVDSYQANFYKLTGGEMEIGRASHDIVYESGESTTLLIPTTISFAPITLSKGIAASGTWYNWFALATYGHIWKARFNPTITAFAFIEGKYSEIIRWNLTNAWISKISGFDTNQYVAGSVSQFSITLVAEAIEREDMPYGSPSQAAVPPEPEKVQCPKCKAMTPKIFYRCGNCHAKLP